MGSAKLVNTEGQRGKFLYRYLKKEHLIDFLETKKLYIPRSNKFKDKFECINKEQIEQIFGLEPITKKEFNYNTELSTEERNLSYKIACHEFSQIKAEIKKVQEETFISCWFGADHETMAMWNMYSEPQNTFALRVDRDKFIKNIRCRPEIVKNKMPSFLGYVHYLNYHDVHRWPRDQEEIYPFFRKHIGFKYEEEFRVVLYRPRVSVEGINVGPLDLNFEPTVILHPDLDVRTIDKIKPELEAIADSVVIQPSENSLIINLQKSRCEK